MINRRGFAPWLTCRSCGRHWDCPNCDVSLIVHRHSGRLVCHHCAHSEPLPARLRRVRLDDALAGGRRHRAGRGAARRAAGADAGLPARLRHRGRRRAPTPRSSPRFGEAESGVLVGTQMVAKGHDFPEVTLSAILDADATLRFPDFRAGERTFAMVAQLAGRRGRGAAGGEVLVQTLAPGRAEHRPRRRATTRPASSPARSSAGGRCATRPSRTWSGSCSAPRPRRGSSEAAAKLAAGARRGAARGRRPARPGADVPRPRAATAAGSWSRPTTARRRSPPSAPRSSGLAADRAPRRDVAIGVDVDPQ